MIPTYKNVNIEPIIMCQPKINFKMRNNVNDLAKFYIVINCGYSDIFIYRP